MLQEHYDLWSECRSFVGAVCADRDASHGLEHMEIVTERSILIYLMSNPSSTPNELDEQRSALLRVIAVGMLHDVNDHKYDKDGSLGRRVEEFVLKIASRLRISESPSMTPEEITVNIMNTTSAISYSKENKNGMRWFESKLPSAVWVRVRDAVSDADKMEAIGISGLLRCYEYQMHVMKSSNVWDAAVEKHGSSVGREVLLPHVVEHADEKLLRLKDSYIVTTAGKFLAAPLHDEMVKGLADWVANGPPSVPGVPSLA